MEGHAKKCVERYCEVAKKNTENLYKVLTSCIDDYYFKEEELKFVEELSDVRSQIALKMSLFSTNWYTINSMVSQQTCTRDLTFIAQVNTNNSVMWETLCTSY